MALAKWGQLTCSFLDRVNKSVLTAQTLSEPVSKCAGVTVL